ncbi:GH24369 [Drosophila grimshawi]|uniref:GH24369 n=1 Tax=Drosophila grimshawi TaxID=7222 RepID=B4JMA1_DROGR|nr:GH24369 [Drosophila grimshawi]
MSRERFNHLRRERESDGLQQILQMPIKAPTQLGGKALPKMMYTRTEMMKCSSMDANAVRGKSLMNYVPRLPEASVATVATHLNACESAPATRCNNFLPRVAKLPNKNNKYNNSNNNKNNNNSNNNNNNNNNKNMSKKLATPSKTCFPKKTKIAANSNEMDKLAKRQQMLQTEMKTVTGINVGSTSSLNNSSSNSSSSASSSSSSSGSGSGSHDSLKAKLADAFRLPDEQNQSFVYLCKPVNEMLQPSVEQPDELQELQQLSVDEGSDVSSCIALESQSSRKQTPEPYLEQEQRQEHKLDVQQDEQEQQQQQQQHKKIELVVQNIPTLQREIRLLQQLGEQLEATLGGSLKSNQIELDSNWANCSDANLCGDASCNFYTPRSNLSHFGYDALPIVHMGWRRIEMRAGIQQIAAIDYYARQFGCVSEYRIEMRTLTQLKTADEWQSFYLPLAEDGGLERTTFRLLRENPNLLLKQLRPLTPARPFNLLEQDAMFFNSMLSYGEPALELRETGGGLPQQLVSLGSLRAVHGMRLAINWSSADVERMLVSGNIEKEQKQQQRQQQQQQQRELLEMQQQLEKQLEKQQRDQLPLKLSHTHSSLRKRAPSMHLQLLSHPKYRPRHQRRLVAPLKTSNPMEPKPHRKLLKTILVGIVQVALFLVLIMAFTYPDIRC